MHHGPGIASVRHSGSGVEERFGCHSPKMQECINQKCQNLTEEKQSERMEGEYTILSSKLVIELNNNKYYSNRYT